MKHWLKENREWALVVYALAMLVVIIYFYVWGIKALLNELNEAVGVVSVSSETTRFNLQGARKILQDRGALPN